MKKQYIRAAALLLALLMALSPAASASYAMGDEIHTVTTHLAEGVEYTRQYIWSETYSDLRTESYIEYTPNALVQPVVAWGDSVMDKQTLSSLAQGLEEEGLRVLGGVNGDYFVLATGVPLGLVITDGVVHTSSSYHYALGFDGEGGAFIGTPEMTVNATFNRKDTYLVYGGLNKARPDTYGYVLYTDEYGPDTDHTASGVDVILRPKTDKLGEVVVEPFRVVIDPGHGGKDPGSVISGEDADIYEKDINFAVALLVEQLLSEYEDIVVYLSREEDVFLSLEGRAQLANYVGADLFVSLHSNSAENAEDYSGILTFYPEEEGRDPSLSAAEHIHGAVCQATGAVDRGIFPGDYTVLQETEMAAVLVEMGFMTNSEELAQMTDPEYQLLLAQGIANGILATLQIDPGESETPDAPEGSEESETVEDPDLTGEGGEAPAEGEEGEEAEDPLIYVDAPTVGGRISCTVQEVLLSDESIEIPEGCLVLSINNKSDAYLVNELASLQPGDTVDIDITCPDPRWKEAVSAIGGMYKMLTDGQVESGLERTQGPRTAVGIREDGSMVFYSVDGRQSGYSVGASMNQVAMRLVELGCVEAICLDGGGSATVGITKPGDDSFGIVNRPSEGTQRALSNALFLAAVQTDAGEAERLIVSPTDAVLLAGSQAQFTAVSVDSMGNKVAEYSPHELTFSFPKAAGTMEGNVLTAGTQQGSHTLTVTADGLTGTAAITTVTTPTQFLLYNEETGRSLSSIRLEVGQSISLTADARFYNLATACGDDLYTWGVTDDLGTIDQAGNLTVGQAAGTGFVTVTAGEYTARFPLSVTGEFYTLENFEGEQPLPEDAALTLETRAAYVRYGKQSAALSYLSEEAADASEDALPGSITVDLPLIFEHGERFMSLWVYSDESGHTLSALFTDQVPADDPSDDPSGEPTDESSDGPAEDAVLTEVPLTVLDSTGWQQLLIPLPEGAAALSGLKLTFTGTANEGTLWLDQFTSSNQTTPDLGCPSASAAVSGSTFTATLTDDLDGSIPAGQVTVTFDGAEIECSLSGDRVTAALPESDGQAHRVTVIVTDASGNMGRASADIASGSGRKMPFDDMGSNWADSFALYLYDQGISVGVASGSKLLFQPNKNITRGEFALMVARWMGLDLTEYSDVELPFADVSKIPSWCLDAIKAMYALGIMQGSGVNGKLYANAQSSLTRAEAMTQLGRILPKGYAQAELTFTDADDIPSWSQEYFALMVAQGIISGYTDGSVAPNNSILRCEIAKILYAMR